MDWKKNYYLPIEYQIKSQYNKHIEKINSYLNLKIKIEKKKKKISIDESNYQNKLDIKKYSDNIDDIKKQTSLEILKLELNIIDVLSKYISQNNYFNKKFIVDTLNILLKFSEILRVRLNLKKIEPKKNKNNIYRCSYKFCNYKDSCMYNYGKNKNVCYADHYVHDRVSSDITSLLNYIKKKYNNSKLIKFEREILKCINTLNYVIKHMESELNSLCLYSEKDEWDSFHFVKKINN